MADRTPLVVGGLAVAAVVGWLALRGEDARPPPVTPGPDAAVSQVVATAAQPTPDAAPDAPATPREREIVERWRQIRGGKLERTTCDAAECRLVVTGTEAEVTRAIEDLEGPRGFHGLARNVHLTSPTIADDGTVTLHVHVRF